MKCNKLHFYSVIFHGRQCFFFIIFTKDSKFCSSHSNKYSVNIHGIYNLRYQNVILLSSASSCSQCISIYRKVTRFS